jgi:glycosyltransferase involved in cell wall biosynthesis
MSKPLLSIITVCYNSDKTIERTLNSILTQSFSNFEYILVDGKSTDNTLKIILSFKDKFKSKGIKFSWISEPDTGIYDAFNKGVRLSSGSWVSFLGSDDYYVNNALEIYADTILKTKDKVDLFYSNVDLINDENKNIDKINGIWTWGKFRRFMNIAHVGSFHNKEYFLKYGYFNESYKIAGDYELLLRAKGKLETIKIEAITVKMSNEGASNNQVNLVFKETLRAKNETGGISLLLCSFDYYIAYLKYQTKKIVNEIIR